MRRTPVFALATALAAVSFGAAAQDNVLKGKAAMGGWQQDKPGLKRHLTLQDQPPSVARTVKNFSEKAPMPGGREAAGSARVHGRDGGIRADDPARHPHGAERRPVRGREGNQPGARATRALGHREARRTTMSSPPASPSPTASRSIRPGANPEWIYIANDDGVVRFRYKTGDLKASGEPELIVKRIPWSHHWTRDIVFTPEGKLLLSVGSGSNVALDMFPSPLTKGGLEAWKKEKPLGAAWDTEETPRGRDVLRSGRQEREDRRDRPAQLLRSRDSSGDQPPVVRGQRARRHRRQHAVRIRDRGEGRRLLRLAVVLCGRPRGPAPEGDAART